MRLWWRRIESCRDRFVVNIIAIIINKYRRMNNWLNNMSNKTNSFDNKYRNYTKSKNNTNKSTRKQIKIQHN